MDWEFIQPVFIWLEDNPAWSSLFVFLIALSESLLIVGLIVPGAVLMFGAGTLVGSGVLSLNETLLWAFIGAVAGDGISFWIGKRYKKEIACWWPLYKYPEYMTKGQLFFDKHGGKSVFFGRFVGPIRPIIPAVAGMMGMNGKYFFLVNILSALLWAPLYLAPGILFGASIELASLIGTRLIIVVVSLIVCVYFLVWVSGRCINLFSKKFSIVQNFVCQWSENHPQIGQYVISIVNENTNEKKGMIFFSIFVGIVTLLITIILSSFQSGHSNVEYLAENLIALLNSPFVNSFVIVVRQFFSFPVLLICFINCFVLFVLINNTGALKYWLILTSGVLLLATFFNFLLKIINAGDTELFSIPIIFTTVILAFFISLLAHGEKVKFRWMAYSTLLSLLLIYAWVETYFGRVSILQVLSSYLLVSFWVVLFSIAYRQHHNVIRNKASILISVLVIGMLVGSLLSYSTYPRELTSLQKRFSLVHIDEEAWREDGWRQLPLRRVDAFGEVGQKFNLQISGNIVDFEEKLKSDGWEKINKFELQNIFLRLQTDVSINELSWIPHLHFGSFEEIAYSKNIAGDLESQLVVQLWPSRYLLAPLSQPIFVGLIAHRYVDKSDWILKSKIVNLDSSSLNSFAKKYSNWGVDFGLNKSINEGMTQNHHILLLQIK